MKYVSPSKKCGCFHICRDIITVPLSFVPPMYGTRLSYPKVATFAAKSESNDELFSSITQREAYDSSD